MGSHKPIPFTVVTSMVNGYGVAWNDYGNDMGTTKEHGSNKGTT